MHYDIIKWKHLPRYWPFVQGIHRSPVDSPHKGQWRGALIFSLICAWIKGWVNNGEAGDFGRHRAHYDVIEMEHNWYISVTRPQCVTKNPDTFNQHLSTGWHLAITISNGKIKMSIPHCNITSPHDHHVPINFIHMRHAHHDDVIKWKHFPRYWPFLWGIHPTQRPVTRSFDVFFDQRLNKR